MRKPDRKEKRLCEMCKGVFECAAYLKGKSGRFCSSSCSAKRQKKIPRLTRPCDFCHKEYKYEKIKNGKTRYCSRICQNRFQAFQLKGKPIKIGTKLKISKGNKGKKHPKLAEYNRQNPKKGALSTNWKGGITPENKRIRHQREYIQWRNNVFARDNWICQDCSQRGGNLEAHHVRPFALFPALRFDIDNGRTLCKPCHSNY